MKKFIFTFLFVFFMFLNPAICETIYVDMNVPYDKELQEQIKEIKPLLQKADETHDMELQYQAFVKGYNIKKTGNEQNIKKYNDLFSALAIQVSMIRYNLTKDKKYLDRAYKWSQIAVKDMTNQIFSIRYDIILASEHLDLKEMMKAYDCYRAVDYEGAKDFLDDFQNIYDNTLAYKNQHRSETKEKWLHGIGSTLKILGNSMQVYGQALEREEYYDAIRKSGSKNTNINIYSY